MSDNSLAVRHTAPMSLADIMQIGQVFAESGMFPDIRSQAQAVVKIMAGQEMGMGPFEALQSVYLIQGRTAVAANAMAAAVKNNPKYDYRVLRLDDEACAIEFFEQSQSLGVSQFTMADARKAQTKNLDKFSRNMMFARAMSNGVRWYTPDVFKGAVYTPEEMGAAVDSEGAVIDAPVLVPPHNTDGEALPEWEDLGEIRELTTPKLRQLIAWVRANQPQHPRLKELRELWESRMTPTTPEPTVEAEVIDVPVEPDPDLATPIGDAAKKATADRAEARKAMDKVPPPPEPKTRTERQAVTGRYRAIAGAAGLDLSDTPEARSVRYAAMSAYLNKSEPVQSMKGFTEAEISVLTASIEAGTLKWDGPEVTQ